MPKDSNFADSSLFELKNLFFFDLCFLFVYFGELLEWIIRFGFTTLQIIAVKKLFCVWSEKWERNCWIESRFLMLTKTFRRHSVRFIRLETNEMDFFIKICLCLKLFF